MAGSGLEMGLPLGFGHSRQLSLNKFFHPNTPSMRKGCDRELEEVGKEEEEKNSKRIAVNSCSASQTPE